MPAIRFILGLCASSLDSRQRGREEYTDRLFLSIFVPGERWRREFSNRRVFKPLDYRANPQRIDGREFNDC